MYLHICTHFVNDLTALAYVTDFDSITLQNFSIKLLNSSISMQGMSRFHARQKIVDFLDERKLLVQVRDHAMSVPICSRTGDIVEPLPKPQWFLRFY